MWVKAINRVRARHIADSDQIVALQTLKAWGLVGVKTGPLFLPSV